MVKKETMESLKYYLKIAENKFQIESPESFTLDESISHFFVEEVKRDEISAYYKVVIEKEIGAFAGRVLYRQPERVILDVDSKECRIFLIPEAGFPYAYTIELDDKVTEIHILDEYFCNRRMSIVFLELLALEKQLIVDNALVFHSAYIIHEGKSILFSAPSGTGKSTQASLWEKYKNAQIVNGDRSIVKISDAKVEVHGLPFCGSSQINYDESAPLAAIVFLEQAKENEIRTVSKAEAIRKIYSQCSVNYWNVSQVQTVFEMLGTLVEQVPVYLLKCTISEEAVELVYDQIKCDDYIDKKKNKGV